MNIYAPKDTDEFVISLKEYLKNNPFNIKDHRPDWIVIPSAFSGQNHSEESKLKMSESAKGRIKPEETRLKLSEALKGRKLSEKHRLKMSESAKGRIKSEEHKLKISASLKGRIKSEEPWNKGKKKIYSQEALQKMSESHKGNKNMLGKKHSEESKQKMSLVASCRDYTHLHKKVLTPNGEFSSLSEAAKYYNKSGSWVTKQLKNNKFKLI
jgi:hypothetical protein